MASIALGIILISTTQESCCIQVRNKINFASCHHVQQRTCISQFSLVKMCNIVCVCLCELRTYLYISFVNNICKKLLKLFNYFRQREKKKHKPNSLLCHFKVGCYFRLGYLILSLIFTRVSHQFLDIFFLLREKKNFF